MDYLDTLSVNKWITVGTNTIADVVPDPEPSGYTGQQAVISAWGGGAYDSTRHYLYVWGGGHTDYSGNEMYAFDFTDLTWKRLTDPSISDTDNGDSYSDGNPTSTHTYGVLEYGGGFFYSFGMPSVWFDGRNHPTIWRFNPTDNSWTNIGNGGVAGYGGGAGYDTNLKIFWYVSTAANGTASRLHYYNPSTGAIVAKGNREYDLEYQDDLVPIIDNVNKRFIMIGDNRRFVWDISDSSSVGSATYVNTMNVAGGPGAQYDPNLDGYVIWSTGQNMTFYDASDWSDSTIINGGASPTATTTGTFGRFRYMPEYNAYCVVNATNGSVYVIKLTQDGSNIPGTNSGNIIQRFAITADTTATNPFTVALGFKKGDVTSDENITLNITDYQVSEMRTWNDGSLKHAIISGTLSMTANIPDTISVYDNGTRPSSTNLTETDIVTAAPEALVGLSGIDTVSLSDLLGSPVQTWLSGPTMVEAHYQTDVVDNISVWFHVRLYSTGDIWIRVVVENGTITGTGNKTYAAFVKIGSDTVLQQGSFTHYAHTRWDATGWIGNDPDITIDIDTQYLETTGLVPNYWKDASETALNGLDTTYAINDPAGWTVNMGETGYQDQIGLLPLWDALYISSDGDQRAFKAVINASRSLNNYPIVWSDPSSNLPIRLTNWSTYTVNGAGGGGETSVGAGSLSWDVAHHGSGGYLAYLITGDFYHLQTMQYQATLCYLMTTSTQGNDTSRVLTPVQTRGVAWSNRTVGQCAAIAPSDTINNELQSLFNTSVEHWNNVRVQEGMNTIGYLYSYEISSGTYGTGVVSPWQQHFWVQTYGMLTQMEPLTKMTNLKLVRDYLYTSVIGILGPSGIDYYCFTDASVYTIKISDTNSSDPTNWYDSWGTVYEETHGNPNTSCGNTLNGNLIPTSYWANLLPAIAYAVEDTATGAYNAWTRLTGATNWSTFEESGFDDIPIWGIYPRSIPQGSNDETPVVTGKLQYGGSGKLRYKTGAMGVLK